MHSALCHYTPESSSDSSLGALYVVFSHQQQTKSVPSSILDHLQGSNGPSRETPTLSEFTSDPF